MSNDHSTFSSILERWAGRKQAYALLLLAGIILFLPNLGSHGLWDVDEAHNAECAREMWTAGELIVPTFNYRLRTDKPVLLYWCIQASYTLLGVNEFAARLPSALAGIFSLWLCYEIARRLFDRLTGLLAGLILGSSFMFCISSHAVTPDALLILCVQATFLTWIIAYDRRQPAWMLLTGVCAGLGVLAKGPVGLLLPGAAVVTFLLWQRDVRFLGNRRTLQALAWTCLVALPWYIWVGIESRWEFIKGFFWTHNVSRFGSAMEGHQGPFFYHFLVILVAFAPWSIFMGPTIWFGVKNARASSQATKPWAYRLLWCWLAVWFVVFSLAATKLPNYVLPIYPPLALLTSTFLVQWAKGQIRLPGWLWRMSLSCLMLVGFFLAAGFTTLAGWFSLPQLQGRTIAEAAYLLPIALLPLLAGAFVWRAWGKQRISWGIAGLAVGAVCLSAALACWGPTLVDHERAIRPLSQQLVEHGGNADYRVGTHPSYYRPSLVFYARRPIIRCTTPAQALEVMQSPVQSYMLVPALEWKSMAQQLDGRFTILDRHQDVTLGQEILLICNQAQQKAVDR